jgi:hypothetical protein
MADHLAREVGLLRAVVRGMELRPSMLPGHLTQDFLRKERISLVRPVGEGLIVIRQPAGAAFSELSECLVSRSPSMERGTVFSEVRNELLAVLKDSFVGRDPATVGYDEVASLHAHFDGWFAQLAAPRRVFVPCVITPWAAPRFLVGPIIFLFIDDASRSEFYPSPENLIARDGFDRLIGLMKNNQANWLACVPVEGCERQRAEEVAALAVDLAIVALQVAIPLGWETRTMGRLNARRGTAERRTLSESRGYYNAGFSRVEAGLPIGTGTLPDILQKTAPTISAVGACVTSFASGRYRLPNLESAWCDAAYWLHEALAEPVDAIAVAKLETALEVLLRAESASGSQRRLEAILKAFYGLGPTDPLHSETSTTVKQFVRGFVGDCSRILHGTWSTLNSRLALSRGGMEEFAIGVIRRAAFELGNYASTAAPGDEIDAWLAWVGDRPVASATASG